MIYYSFKNDYSEGAHPKILDALIQKNTEQHDGYGEDYFSSEAKKLIQQHINDKDADIHFVSGGTQANLISLSSMLKPYQSVIAAQTGHIAVHEAGAIEATGHKINTVISDNGKVTVSNVQCVLESHTDEHQVQPKVVFISNSTEVGTVYSKKELTELSSFCKNNGLFLYLDGARLGSALTSKYNDLTLADISNLTDMFYIGGTKNGALIGEAIVISNTELKRDFRYHLKQRGALLAKGRLLGIQFLEMFSDGLYYELARHANSMAELLAEGIQNRGYDFLTKPVSNQIFPIFPDCLIADLQSRFGFYVWSQIDESHSAVRLVTSWATERKQVDSFINEI